jgi:hypothetical protein
MVILRGLKMETRDISYDELSDLLDEKYDDIAELMSVLREIYAVAGEDKNISRICNAVFEDVRFKNA